MNHRYAGFGGYDATGDRSLFGLGLTGADAMVDLFDERARQIVVGEFPTKGPDDGTLGDTATERPPGPLSAVDNLYTAGSVLWRAYRETGAERFRDVALAHADRHLDWFVGGRTDQLVAFDADTGAVRERANLLAYSGDTCWARGQGWNLAGLALAYRETRAGRFLDAVDRTMRYYREHTPDDLVPFWDFEDPAIPDAPRDTSTAALAAYALVGLPDGGADAGRLAGLRATGRRILRSLIDDYLVREGPRRGMVLRSCYSKPGGYATAHESVWTDYYVAAALDVVADGATASDRSSRS